MKSRARLQTTPRSVDLRDRGDACDRSEGAVEATATRAQARCPARCELDPEGEATQRPVEAVRKPSNQGPCGWLLVAARYFPRMSAENVELVRRSLQLWEERDFDGLAELADPEFALDLSRNVDAEVHPGIDGLQRWTDRIGEMWKDFQVEPQEVVEAGERVVTCVRLSGRGLSSGVEAEMKVFQVWSLRHGKILRITGGYRDRAEAMNDAREHP
jgi:ketosteroid isomerase-like protein